MALQKPGEPRGAPTRAITSPGKLDLADITSLNRYIGNLNQRGPSEKLTAYSNRRASYSYRIAHPGQAAPDMGPTYPRSGPGNRRRNV